MRDEYGDTYADDVAAHIDKLTELDGPVIDPMGAWHNNPYVMAIKAIANDTSDPYRYLVEHVESDATIAILAEAALIYRENHPYCGNGDAMSYVPKDFERNGICFDDTPRRVIQQLYERDVYTSAFELLPARGTKKRMPRHS